MKSFPLILYSTIKKKQTLLHHTEHGQVDTNDDTLICASGWRSEPTGGEIEDTQWGGRTRARTKIRHTVITPREVSDAVITIGIILNPNIAFLLVSHSVSLGSFNYLFKSLASTSREREECGEEKRPSPITILYPLSPSPNHKIETQQVRRHQSEKTL